MNAVPMPKEPPRGKVTGVRIRKAANGHAMEVTRDGYSSAPDRGKDGWSSVDANGGLALDLRSVRHHFAASYGRMDCGLTD